MSHRRTSEPEVSDSKGSRVMTIVGIIVVLAIGFSFGFNPMKGFFDNKEESAQATPKLTSVQKSWDKVTTFKATPGSWKKVVMPRGTRAYNFTFYCDSFGTIMLNAKKTVSCGPGIHNSLGFQSQFLFKPAGNESMKITLKIKYL